MKKRRTFLLLFFAFLIYFITTLWAYTPLPENQQIIQAYNSDNLVRLHITANSNSPIDQYVKRQIRDIISNEKNLSVLFSQEKPLQNIKKKIDQILLNKEVNYQAEVSYGEHFFPGRSYGNTFLPAGEYNALVIKLGRSEGSNWWCVLYPAICLKQANIKEESENITEFLFYVEEELSEKEAGFFTSLKKGIEFRLKIMDLFQNLNIFDTSSEEVREQ